MELRPLLGGVARRLTANSPTNPRFFPAFPGGASGTPPACSPPSRPDGGCPPRSPPTREPGGAEPTARASHPTAHPPPSAARTAPPADHHQTAPPTQALLPRQRPQHRRLEPPVPRPPQSRSATSVSR